MYRHILIPTDGSDLSEKAITNGIALAQTLASKATGLYVLPATLPFYYAENAWVDPGMERRLRDSAQAQGGKIPGSHRGGGAISGRDLRADAHRKRSRVENHRVENHRRYRAGPTL